MSHDEDSLTPISASADGDHTAASIADTTDGRATGGDEKAALHDEAVEPTVAAQGAILSTTSTESHADATPIPPRRKRGCLGLVAVGIWRCIRFAFRKWRVTLTLILLAAAAFLIYRAKKVYLDGGGTETVQAIDATPEEIRSLKEIGQWEFLSVDTEELVESNRNSLLSSKQLVCVYRGTLRLGIDLAKAENDFCTVEGKSVTLRLPDIALLDPDFIDDTRTTVFYEDGNWNAGEKEQLRAKAAEAMRKRALSAENISLARRNAEEQFTQLFRAIGYDEVNVVFENASSDKEH